MRGLISEENRRQRDAIQTFEKRIEAMHLEFIRFRHGETTLLPDWEGLERELLAFSRRRFKETGLATQLDRILFKFQNRKRIWLKWVGETLRGP